MAECIVCGGFCDPGSTCQRCGSDDRPRQNWRQRRPEERGGLAGLLAFTAPHFYAPVVVTLLAAAFGLIGLGGLWGGIRPSFQLLVVVLTVCGCLLATQANYEHRHTIRVQQLLNRVRRGWGALLRDARLRALVLPALSMLVILLAAYTLITSDVLWELARWWFFEPGYGEQVEEGVQGRVLASLPLFLMLAYGGFMVSFTYSSSLLVVLRYASAMNGTLPLPIFLDGRLLAQVVRKEAHEQLDRERGLASREMQAVGRGQVISNQAPPARGGGAAGRRADSSTATQALLGPTDRITSLALPPAAPLPEVEKEISVYGSIIQQWGRWNWEEVERTSDGGIVMKARSEGSIETVETNAGLSATQRTCAIYTVTAGPWGRIREISCKTERVTL